MPADDTSSSITEADRINWVRAVFVGAIVGGVLWALIVWFAPHLDPGAPYLVQLTAAMAAVCLPVALLGAWMYRGSADVSARTIAVATLIAAAANVFMLLLVFLLA